MDNKIALENINKSLKDVDRAMALINKSQNQELLRLKNSLKTRKDNLLKSQVYFLKLVEGPWLDTTGYINRGSYGGLYIGALFQALASSGKDFPSAVAMIGRSVNDPTILSIDATMYPTDAQNSNKAYGVFMALAPDENWERIHKIAWDT